MIELKDKVEVLEDRVSAIEARQSAIEARLMRMDRLCVDIQREVKATNKDVAQLLLAIQNLTVALRALNGSK